MVLSRPVPKLDLQIYIFIHCYLFELNECYIAPSIQSFPEITYLFITWPFEMVASIVHLLHRGGWCGDTWPHGAIPKLKSKRIQVIHLNEFSSSNRMGKYGSIYPITTVAGRMVKDNRGAKDKRSHCLLRPTVPQLIKLVSLTKEAWVGLDRAKQVNNASPAF